MAYDNKKPELPKRPKKIGSLWKSTDGGAVLDGYLDLGIDARVKIHIKKNDSKTGRQPDYALFAMVPDFQSPQAAVKKAPEVSNDDIPF